jgi:hypothetical protein
MEILDDVDGWADLDPRSERVLVALNADSRKLGMVIGPLKGLSYRVHEEFGAEAGRFEPATGLIEVAPRSALVLVLPETR